MNFFESILLSIILITFPVMLYLFYLAYNKNINKKEKEMFFSLAIISSFYLVYKNMAHENQIFCILLLSIPILISFLKNKTILSTILVFSIYVLFNSSLIHFIIIQYLFLFFLCFEFNKKNYKTRLFVIIYIFVNILFSIIFNSYYNINIIKLIFIFVIYFLATSITCILFFSGEKIIKYHMSFKQLQEEKQIRLSLFKITHEIKNPIAVIKGYLDMLDVKNEKQVEKYIPIINSEINRLLNLLEDFLMVNKNNMDFDIMDIDILIEETLYKFNNLSSNITINYEPLEDEIFINGDYNRLGQVLINIIKNSIESIGEKRNGKIDIKTKIINKYLQIIINDNGYGMNKRVLSRIKEPFYTTKNRGTGLGVSLAYEIIEAHKGIINYESQEGIGTKVTISLPLYN